MTHIDNPEILEIIDRAGKGERLSAREHRIYVTLILTAARLAQSAHYQTQLGLLDNSKLESLVYNLIRHLKTATGQTVWSELGARSDPQFKAYVESLVDRADSYESLLSPQDAPANPA